MQNDRKQDRAHSNVSKRKVTNEMNNNAETVLQSVKCETVAWMPALRTKTVPETYDGKKRQISKCV